MNDDRPDLEVFQQCRDLVFGDWTSAAMFVPLRVWIGEKLLHHLLNTSTAVVHEAIQILETSGVWKMRKQVIAAATAIVLGITTIPTYSMAAGTDIHEMLNPFPSEGATPEVSPSELKWGRGTHRHYLSGVPNGTPSSRRTTTPQPFGP
jgi:hypothetical protein